VPVTMYGIKSCDTVRKARAWLDRRGVAHAFHDYKAQGIDEAVLDGWIGELGWEKLLNRTGTTFRKLPEAARQNLDAASARALMLAQPTMIRRPVLDLGGQRMVGFEAAAYEAAFGAGPVG
jgi:arsenate reductase